MATESLQRTYEAPCPGCGAPVRFLSAQSTHAVCSYCQSTVVRSGETLARIGKMAELFDDHSPLQLMASGVWKRDAGEQRFTLAGRLQYKYGEGTWTEWHALLADGTSAFLSEDNGAYVFATPLEPMHAVPEASHFRVGASTSFNGRAYSVASNQQVLLIAAAGELPHLPELGKPFAMVELRSQAGGAGIGSAIVGAGADTAASGAEVLSIDYGTQPPTLSHGGAVALEDLQLSGLRDASGKQENARQFACPNCGAPVQVALAGSKSITCPSCNSIIDMTQGMGAELRHALQDEPVQPLIPLGTLGQLQGVQWQVVGFQHRMGTDPADPDEHFGWEEYLLYNRKRGFIFLVDSSDGWSVVKPTTGAPVVAGNGQSASYLGQRYQQKESYDATTTYVAGEFYWQVSRGQKTRNRDFANGKSLLSMEQSASELTWSVGGQISSEAVVAAFKLEAKKDLLQRTDAAPIGLDGGGNIRKIIIGVVVILILLALFTRSNCDPAKENCSSSSSSSGYRSSGGSYGGYSGGGGHK